MTGVLTCQGDRRPGNEIAPAGEGSIIIVLATDAPLLTTRIKRLVWRTALGLARIGGMGYNGSGDIFVGFSTANRQAAAKRGRVVELEVALPHDRLREIMGRATPFVRPGRPAGR